MSRRLVVLRHGRTSWNATHRAQGHADIGLDEVGRAQAAAVAPVLAGLEPVRIVTSDLLRARQTAAYVEQATGLTAVLDARLREYDVGERTGLTLEQFAHDYPAEYAAWMADHDQPRVAGAESTLEVAARIGPALKEIVAGLHDGQTAVAVTHGAALKVGIASVCGMAQPVARTALRGMDNCGWAVLVDAFDPDYPHPRIEAYNRTVPSGLPDLDPGPDPDFAPV